MNRCDIDGHGNSGGVLVIIVLRTRNNGHVLHTRPPPVTIDRRRAINRGSGIYLLLIAREQSLSFCFGFTTYLRVG